MISEYLKKYSYYYLTRYSVTKKKFENILKRKISKDIKAIIMVHTYGLASNIKEIIKLKKKYNFKVIEDCAEGLGLKHNNRYH